MKQTKNDYSRALGFKGYDIFRIVFGPSISWQSYLAYYSYIISSR